MTMNATSLMGLKSRFFGLSVTFAALVSLAAQLPATPAHAAEGFSTVQAVWVDGALKGDTRDPIWQTAPALPILSYRQRTTRLYDRNANKALAKIGPRHAWVQAAYSKTHLAVSITWEDSTPSHLQLGKTDAFGDAAALALPQTFGEGVSLPYIGMGDEKHPVIINVKRAHKDDKMERQFVAAGFGSLTRIKLNTQTSMAYHKGSKRWQVTFVRPLKDNNVDLAKGLVPVAFALWDGAALERGGNKSVTRWQFIRLGKHPLSQKYLQYVSWGEDGKPIGDVAKGEKFVGSTCIGCHHVGKHKVALTGVAPSMGNIGGYGLAQYLKESVISPSAVVIRQPNLNRHYSHSKGGKAAKGGKGAHGHHSYPANSAYVWYTGHGANKKSKMPSFKHLPADQINNIVAYLKSLKHTPTTPAPPFKVAPADSAAAPAAPAPVAKQEKKP